MKKSPQKKTFCGRGRGEDKNDGEIKRHNLQEFQDCFKRWKTRLDWYIALNGQYFEGY